jgi:hypothetical protein
MYSCQGGGDAVIQTPMAVVTDGDGQYANLLSCTWRFAPVTATAVSVYFLQFGTEPGYDFLYVEQCAATRRNNDAFDPEDAHGVMSESESDKTGKKKKKTNWLGHSEPASLVEEGDYMVKASVHVADAVLHLNDGHRRHKLAR